MNNLDTIMFILICFWIVAKIRANIRINQSLTVVYGLILTTVRFIKYLYWLNVRYSKRATKIAIESLPSPQVHPYEVSLGKMNNRDFVVNIMDHHSLIGATSGGGKTYMLHSILKQLYDKGSVFFDNTDVYVIDLKGHPRDMIHLWKPVLKGYATRIGSSLDDALAMLRNIESKLGQELDRKILLIVDEAYILTGDKEGDQLLGSIASQLRLNGSLILLVQSPQYAIVKTFIRYNIERRIMGLVMNRDQGRIILDIRPKQDELPSRVGEYVIREPGKNKLLRTSVGLMDLPKDILETIEVVLKNKAEDSPETRLLIDIIGTRKLGEAIMGVRTIAQTLDMPNAQNYVMVAYRNFTNAGILNPPRVRGGRYTLAVADLNDAITKLQSYLPNWEAAPESFIE